MKKIISILLSAALLTFGSGCESKNEKSETDSSAVQTETTEPTNSAGYKIIEPPANGWTIEELLSVTYLCDKQLSYPLTVESMGEGFEIANEMVHEHERGPRVDAELLYNNEFLGGIFLPVEKIEDVTNDLPIDHLTLNVYSDVYKNSGKSVSVNGVAFGDSKDELIKALGTPSSVNEGTRTITYIFRDDSESKIIASFDDDDIFHSITFYYLNV